MVQKVMYSDIESNRTQGEGAALLVNDIKRAVNEMIDEGTGGGAAIPEPTIIENTGTDIFSLTLGDYSVNRTSVWNSLINKPPVDNIKAIIHVRHTTIGENTYEVFRVIKDVTNNDIWVQSRGEGPAINSPWVKLIKGDDSRLSDSREWVADIVPQAEAEGGIATTARKWTAQRVFQAISSWVSNNLGSVVTRNVATTAEAESGVGTQIPDVSGVAAEIDALRPKATTAEAQAGTANKYPDAAGVHAAIRGLAVGTVSQSGGVPTGAVIQRGSNANGEFIKYADGTQICTYRRPNATLDVIRTGADPGGTGLWNYPAPFVNDNVQVFCSGMRDIDTGNNDAVADHAIPRTRSVTPSEGVVVLEYDSQSNTTKCFSAMAIGRWY